MNSLIEKKIYSIIMKHEELSKNETDIIDDVINLYFQYLNIENSLLSNESKDSISYVNNIINYIFSRNTSNPTPATIYATEKINHKYETDLQKDNALRKVRMIQNAKKDYQPNGYIKIGFIVTLTILFGFILGVILWNIK